INDFMKQGNQSESSLKRKMGLDRISNLPSDVIGQILSSLPIKEAVKTSVLSSKWRFNSAMIPHLVFDYFSTSDRTFIESIVDQVLVLHVGSIHTFRLSHPDIVATSAIDHWIRHLSRNAIKELVLEILEGDTYKIPSCLFSYQYLVHLELYNCLLKPPSTFKGFGRLKVLCLDLVTVAQDVLDNLIVCCPLLERLTLTKCDGFNILKIDAPSLKFFEFDGSLEHVSIMNTLNLAEVCINLVGDDLTWTRTLSSSHLVNFLAHLLHIRRLTVQTEFLAYLADGNLPVKLPEPYMYLNFLSMSISFHISKEAFDEDQPVEEEVNSWLDDNQDCLWTRLRLVQITNISGIKAELDFIEFLHSSSPVLEKMAVKPASDECSSDLLKNMIRFRHASAHCEIIYLDP
ncbi:F-box/FBD/LRR-repeat protein, partial [Pyrus ussuriensis x Pyrus communis]